MADPYASLRGPLKQAIVNRVAAGRSLTAICAAPAVPCRATVHHWLRADAGFAAEVARARGRAETLRVAFHEDVAQRIVAGVAAGRRIADLLTEPGMPSHSVYRRWRRQQGGFAGELFRLERLHDAERGARRAAAHARPYDSEVADRIYLRVLRGAPLKPALRADPAFPSYQVVARWRREQPEFDRMMAFAISRQRGLSLRALGGPSPRLIERIADRVVEGASLAEIARGRGMPSIHTLYAWKRTRPDFAEALAAARDAQGDWCADQVLIAGEEVTPATVRAARRHIAPLKKRCDYLRKRDAKRWREEHG